MLHLALYITFIIMECNCSWHVNTCRCIEMNRNAIYSAKSKSTQVCVMLLTVPCAEFTKSTLIVLIRFLCILVRLTLHRRFRGVANVFLRKSVHNSNAVVMLCARLQRRFFIPLYISVLFCLSVFYLSCDEYKV